MSESDAASADTTTTSQEPEKKSGGFLNTIERIGDKVPHPAVIFIALCALVIVLSQVLYLFDISVTNEVVKPVPIDAEVGYPGDSDIGEIVPGDPQTEAESLSEDDYIVVVEETKIEGLLTGDGLRFLFTTPVQNFNSFGVVGVILVAMVGVGVAERSGLIAALIRKLVKSAPPWSITYIIVFLGLVSSVASDAGYLVLIPLGAAAFYTLGRNPLAGVAAAFAGVSAGFGVNILITPFDGVLAEVTTEAARLVDPEANVGITDNWYFGIGSTLFLTIVMTFVIQRIVEPRLGTFSGTVDTDEAEEEHDPVVEARGIKFANLAMLGTLAVILLLVLPPNAVLRNPETGSIIVESPFMSSILVLITMIFLAGGIGYGIGANTLRGATAIIDAVTKTFAGLSGLILLLLIIAQFIAYFNYSNMATVLASSLADALKRADIGALLLLLLFIFVTFLLNVLIPGILPKWAIFAPVFVPLMFELGVAPQTVLAAYRIGDSPTNVITPLMVYLPFIVIICQRYKKDSGVGTVVSLMLPITIVVAITWMAFFAVWYLLGIPLGPGAPVKL